MPNTIPDAAQELLKLSEAVSNLSNRLNRLAELQQILQALALMQRRLPLAPQLPAPEAQQ